MSAKFDEKAHNGSVSIVFTRSKRDGHTHGHTDGTTAALLYPLRNALRGDKNICNNNVGYCIHYSWDLKFVGKAIHENNENWIPTNKKYFTVFINTYAKQTF